MSPLDRHEKIALSFSGGKDSTAVVHLLREHLHRICVYHVDTGDLLPEMVDAVRWIERICPNFVRIETHVGDWIAENGLPTDVLPHSQHQIGRLMAESDRKLVGRYDCCGANLMTPLFRRVRDDGNTLLIRGTKRADMRKLPVETGFVHEGVEIWNPLQEWTHQQVFDYLAAHDIKLPPIYNHVTNAPECARCSAWWGEGRAEYLKAHHPDLFRDYQDRLRIVVEELQQPLRLLQHEFTGV